ncbi:DUF4157 domain-containing protein [Lentzea sp. BCCO 10_0856]|uniref:DUF4157 domain-containing protein n=1 Tax=Lentzea miocenica TaxID=3095431 RepID=A0ABU4SZQ9_9PSEU|nr:DUF4157 domain-containing protein [Lentzea sp. BCCO 10_0856]MDX8031401.1 DUF4157 domain-containing protein [Lentzea sp. BCCO 10_0856]
MTEPAGAERRAKGAAPSSREPAPPDLGRTATATTGTGGASLGQLAVRAKSKVGATGDPAEKEADTVADQVMRRAVVPPVAAGQETIRRQATVPDEGGDTTDQVQSQIDVSVGHPLPPQARVHFESALSRDFGDVRIHDDAAAARAADSLNAMAFTRGHDIYFASGAYDPDSEGGRRLLAHELAHVVQQTGRAEAPIRRETKTKADPKKPAYDNKAAPSTTKFDNPKVGKIDTDAKTGEIAKLAIPPFKRKLTDKTQIKLRKSGEKRSTDQIAQWEATVLADVETAVKGRVKQRTPPHYLSFEHKRWRTIYFIGTPAEIAKGVARPGWDQKGDSAQFDVDHKLEYQLGGHDKTPTDNLWLLDSGANRSAGSQINVEIVKQRDALITAARPHLKPSPRPNTVLRDYTFTVAELVDGKDPDGTKVFWTAADMKKAAVAKPLRWVPKKKIDDLRGSAKKLSLYTRAQGGRVKQVPFDGKSAAPKDWEREGLFTIKKVNWTPPAGGAKPGVQVGNITGTAFSKPKKGKETISPFPLDIPIIGMTGVEYGGFLRVGPGNKARSPLFSPVEFGPLEFDVERGLLGRGRILPDIALLQGRADLSLILDERGLGLEAVLTAGSFALPGPFKITGGYLALSAAGLPPKFEADGRVGFEIESLATGFFEASLAGGAFGVAGELNFDKSIFTEAKLGVSHREGKWGVTGKLAIGEKRVTGIKSASATVKIEGDSVTADGEFESSVKGVKSGKLGFSYDPTAGMSIDGLLTLGELPGIRGGTVKAKVAKKKDGEGWSLAGEVTAEPAIPGVTGSITGRYEDGAFLAMADLAYQRGLLDGRLMLGLTNQKPGPDGKPAGPPEPGLLIVHGRGSLALKLTPWLVGTATVEVRPNGTIAVAGGIALPLKFELFARKELNRRIFSIGIDIPIVGISVLGQRIGIFATIGGGMDLVAGIGPGVLLGTGIQVSYDPEREDATTVEGQTQLVVPADAGLRLFVQGSVGAGIPVVSARAGVELAGQLGIAGQLTAAAHLLWTRSAGLVLDAEASLSASPAFRFTIDAFALVEAEAFGFSKELYSKKWKLAAFEFGSALTFGVTLPVHAEAGDFQLDFAKMRFVYPSIDPSETARGVLRSAFDA